MAGGVEGRLSMERRAQRKRAAAAATRRVDGGAAAAAHATLRHRRTRLLPRCGGDAGGAADSPSDAAHVAERTRRGQRQPRGDGG